VVELTRGQLVAWAAAAALIVFAAVRLLAPGGASPAPPPVRVNAAQGEERGGSRGGLYVHVAGAVRRPGLYRVRSSARVAVALERAGGPLRRADLAAINLAATVEDGQQIKVPRVGETPASPTPGGPSSGAAAGGAGGAGGGAAKLSLASATVEQLDQLDGIGPTLAKRIVQYRDEKGGFRSVDGLREVEGIGEKRFAALREAVAP